MLVYELSSRKNISAVPRIAPIFSDILEITIISEDSNYKSTQGIDFTLKNGRISFKFNPLTPFKSGSKYSISIKNTTTEAVIYRGKMLVVKQNTDIQNYTPSTQQAQRYKIKGA